MTEMSEALHNYQGEVTNLSIGKKPSSRTEHQLDFWSDAVPIPPQAPRDRRVRNPFGELIYIPAFEEARKGLTPLESPQEIMSRKKGKVVVFEEYNGTLGPPLLEDSYTLSAADE